MEKFITITMVLFMLSMINEKLVNIIRELRFFKAFFNIEIAELKHKRIQGLSFFTGIFISSLTNTDILQIYKTGIDGLCWTTPKFEDFSLNKIIGFLATGLFLSFGSKFFHDLLDILLQIKDLKRKTAITDFDQIQTITDAENITKSNAQEVFEAYLKTFLKDYPEVISHEMKLDTKTIRINLITEDTIIGDTLELHTSQFKPIIFKVIKTLRG